MSIQNFGVFDYKAPGGNKDRFYPSGFRNGMIRALVGLEGIPDDIDNNLNAMDTSDGIELKFKIFTGVAFVKGGFYELFDDGTGDFIESLIDDAVPGLKRFDVAVIEWNSLDAVRTGTIKIIKGVASVTPILQDVLDTLVKSDVNKEKGIYQMPIHAAKITGGDLNALELTDLRVFFKNAILLSNEVSDIKKDINIVKPQIIAMPIAGWVADGVLFRQDIVIIGPYVDAEDTANFTPILDNAGIKTKKEAWLKMELYVEPLTTTTIRLWSEVANAVVFDFVLDIVKNKGGVI